MFSLIEPNQTVAMFMLRVLFVLSVVLVVDDDEEEDCCDVE